MVVAVVALAFRYQSDRRQTIDYLNEASAIAAEHQQMSLLMAELFMQLGGADREDVLTRLDLLSAQASVVQTRVDALVVTPAVGEVNGYLRVATGSWQAAIDNAGPTILHVLDQPEDVRNGDRRLQAVFTRLLVGDQAYNDLLTTVVEMDLESAEFPVFAYVGLERETLYDAESVGQRLRSLRSLVESHDVALTATLDPEPTGERDGVAVLPNTGPLSVLAVLSNNGNVQETGIEVRLTLRTSGEEPIVLTHLEASLDPGQSVAVDFSQIDITPGVAYDMIVTATVAVDETPSNNAVQLVFQLNTDS